MNLNILYLARLVTIAFGVVYGGYVLMPIPPVLEHLFNTSQLFKLVVLVTIMANTIGELSVKSIGVSTAISGLLLAFFEYLRR